MRKMIYEYKATAKVDADKDLKTRDCDQNDLNEHPPHCPDGSKPDATGLFIL